MCHLLARACGPRHAGQMSRRRWSIAALVVLGLALSAAALSWQMPRIARWLVVRQIEAVTGRRVTVERFDLALERGRLEVRGLRLADREPGPSWRRSIGWTRASPRARCSAAAWIVREATIDGVRVRIVRTERGELNIADLLRRPPSREAPPAVSIDRLTLTAGALTVEDRALATARIWRAEAITVEASALSTVDAAPRGALRLAASVAGAPLSVELTELGLVPLRARARVALKSVDVAVAQIVAPADAPLVLDRAALTADLTAALEGGALPSRRARVARRHRDRAAWQRRARGHGALAGLCRGRCGRARSGDPDRPARGDRDRDGLRPARQSARGHSDRPAAAHRRGHGRRCDSRPRALRRRRGRAAARSTCRGRRAWARCPPTSARGSRASTSRCGMR